MPDSFGAQLRQRREERQVSLATIAEQTKIKQSLLEALERDDLSRWPAGIFRRAFIRAYAHAIGLQPDAVVKEFLEHHPDPPEEIAMALGAEGAGDAASPDAAPPTWFRRFVGPAVGSFSRLRPDMSQRSIFHADDRAPAASAPPAIPALPEAPAAVPAVPVVPEAPPVTIASPEAPADVPVLSEPDLPAVARLCTELGQADETTDAAPMLQELARLVDAVGLIVWTWDPEAAELTPALTHGYSNEVLGQLPSVKRDARNATAAAFRAAEPCSVSGGDAASDALVVPLLLPTGCAGVLAIELQPGGARSEWVRALATIFAAQMTRLVQAVRPLAATGRRLA
jgi:transcriptional regulator with XRE-family HTH domain